MKRKWMKKLFFLCVLSCCSCLWRAEIEDEGRNNERKKLNEVKQKRSNESAVH